MKKLFSLAKIICCGTLISYSSPSYSRANTVTARYYFFSAPELALDIKHTGVMKFVAVDDGNINYTRMNFTGKKPSRNSRLVHFLFGTAPIETHLVLDSEANKAHRRRMGLKTANILLDRAAKRDNAERPGTASGNDLTHKRLG